MISYQSYHLFLLLKIIIWNSLSRSFYSYFLYFFAAISIDSMNAGYFIRKKFVNAGMEIQNLFPDSLLLQNKKFKNLHAGQRCFILGSGHSILTHDLTKLSNEIVITQNHFHSHKDISIIHPKYHV